MKTAALVLRYAIIMLNCAILVSAAPAEIATPGLKAVYGPDSREEDDAQSAAWRTIGDATVMVLSANCASLEETFGAVDSANERELTYDVTLGDARGTCGGTAPFIDQLEPGCCSGTLIAPDKIATAGHCINADSCGINSFVFGATNERFKTGARFKTDLIYSCKSVDISVLHGTQDWAVVTLDRPVPTSVASPVVVQSAEAAAGTSLMMIGHPSGIPRKYAGDASVVEVQYSGSADLRFGTDLDAFGGNSGSGVRPERVEPAISRARPACRPGDYEFTSRCRSSTRPRARWWASWSPGWMTTTRTAAQSSTRRALAARR